MTQSPIPGFDLTRQYAQLAHELEPAVLATLRSTKYIMGEQTKVLEASLAKQLAVKHVYACGNGSDAIVLALQAVGVGAGDEVIVPGFTFFATAGSVVRLGATPVFVDVRMDTFNIDEAAIEGAITARTKAIMPVHVFGQIAAMDKIVAIAKAHNLSIVADAAQAIGAQYEGKHLEDWSDVSTYSFFPTKNLGAAGDAGLVTTENEIIGKKLAILRVHGAPRQYYHELVGMNSRMDELQATVLQVKLPHLKQWATRRAAIAAMYTAGLAGLPLVITPVCDPKAAHVWHQYTLRILGGERDALRAHLQAAGIGSMVYYPLPLDHQPCFAELPTARSCPVALQLTHEVLSLPIFPELTDEEVDRIIETVTKFFKA